MRIRGRRVALLLAGALPLLAVDDHQDVATMQEQDVLVKGHSILPEEIGIQPLLPVDDDPLSTPEETGEADGGTQLPSLLPLNLLQVEADLSLLVDADSESVYEGFARGVSKLEQHVSVVVKEDKGIHEDENNDEEEGVNKGDNDFKEDSEDNDVAKDDDIPALLERDLSEVEEEIIENNEDATQSKTEDDDLKEDSDRIQGFTEDNIVDGAANAEGEDGDSIATANSTLTNNTEVDIGEEHSNSTNDNSTSVNSTEDGDGEALDAASHDANNNETQQQSPHVDQAEDEESDISDRVAVDYASKSAGALVLEKSPGFKGTSNLLNGNRDKYAISPCNEKKFVVLSLSEDIYVKQVKIANYELYSSRVKDIKIQISQTMGNWIDLGSYTASPASGVQTIDLREPAWGRYLKFKFKSHYGDEFYCTLSQIMVHGSTMVQGFHEQFQEEFNDEEEDLGVLEGDDKNSDAVEDDEVLDTPEGNTITNSSTIVDADGEIGSTMDEAEKDVEGDMDDATADLADVNSEKQIQVDGTDASNDEGTTEGGDTAVSSTETLHRDVREGEDSPGSEVNMGTNEESADKTETKPTEIVGPTKARAPSMFSRKDRNFSTALPAASVGVSSNPFSSIIGRLEPLHVKSVHELHKIGERFPRPEQLNDILTRATDSTKAIKNALIDPATLENLQVWNEGSRFQPPQSAFDLNSIGPREQTLHEKLTEYIEDSDDSLIKTATTSTETKAGPSQVESTEEVEGETKVGDASKQLKEQDTAKEMEETPQEGAAQTHTEQKSSFEHLRDTDTALVDLLDKLPSIDCLKGLDFAAFKDKALAARKGGHGNSGHAAPTQAAEPIFKMLTDQIKSLQSSLAVHDQFTKETVQCYQRVLLDVVVEMQTLRLGHEARLLKLEQDLQETRTVRWVFVVYQMLMGLPNWASLFIATFFTSFASPVIISRPLEMVQSLLGEHLSPSEHFLLKWTVLTCIILLVTATTVAFCHRIMSKIKWPGRKKPKEITKRSRPKAIEDPECELTVKDAKGDIIITPATGSMSIRKLPQVEPDPVELAAITPSNSDLAEGQECELNVEDAKGDIITTPAAEPQSISKVDPAVESDSPGPRAATVSPVGVENVPQSPLSVTPTVEPVTSAASPIGSDAAPVSPSSVATPPACDVGGAAGTK